MGGILTAIYEDLGFASFRHRLRNRDSRRR
jgi:hypothetical protein